MHQPVLVHANVHERPEGGHVRDHAFEDHARLEVGDLFNALGEGGCGECRARVAAWLLELFEDVSDGGQADGVGDELFGAQGAQDRAVAHCGFEVGSGCGQDGPDHRVRLGVHAGGIQGVIAVGDAQEAGTLLERLGAEAGHLLDRRAALERAVGVAVQDDILRQARADAGHPGQQGSGRGVDVDANRVHTVLDHGVQRLGEFDLGQVVLVLPHADRARVDLHQLGQGVLQAPGDGHRAAQGHVHAGQLLRGVRGGRVNRRAGFGDHDLGEVEFGVPLDQVGGELVGLARGGAVADRDEVHVVLLGQLRQRVDRGVPLVLRHVRVDGRGGHAFAGRVDDGNLDPRTESGVQTHGGARAGGRGKQQVAQVGREHPHGFLLGGLPQPDPQVGAQMDQNAGAPRPAYGVGQPAVTRAALVGDAVATGDRGFERRGVRFVGGRLHREVEDLFLLAAEHGEDAVRGQLRVRLGEVEVVGELGAVGFLALADLGDQPAPGPHAFPQGPDQVGVLSEAFDEDRASTVEGRCRIGDTLLGVGKSGCFGTGVARRVTEQQIGQRLKAGLAGDLRAGAALGLERQVDVLEAGLGLRGHDLCFERLVEFALGADALEHRRAALLQLPQVAEPLLQDA